MESDFIHQQQMWRMKRIFQVGGGNTENLKSCCTTVNLFVCLFVCLLLLLFICLLLFLFFFT